MKLQDLYTKYSLDIFRFAMYKLHNREEAEDVLSETFLRVAKAAKQDIKDWKLWLIGTARNVIREKYRENAKTSPLDQTEIEVSDETEEISKTEVDNQTVEMIKQKLDELDDLVREVIILKIWEDMTFIQIAGIQDTTESTVKLRYYRGLEKIKIALGEKQKSKKMYALSFPLLAAGIKQISTSSELQIMPKFVIKSILTHSLAAKVIAVTAVIATVTAGALILNNANNNVVPNTSDSSSSSTTPQPTYLNYSSNIRELSFNYPESWGQYSLEVSDAPCSGGTPAKTEKISFSNSQVPISVGCTFTGIGGIEEVTSEKVVSADEKKLQIKTYKSTTSDSYTVLLSYNPARGDVEGVEVFMSSYFVAMKDDLSFTEVEQVINDLKVVAGSLKYSVKQTDPAYLVEYHSPYRNLVFSYPSFWEDPVVTLNPNGNCSNGTPVKTELISFPMRHILIGIGCNDYAGPAMTYVSQEDILTADNQKAKLSVFYWNESPSKQWVVTIYNPSGMQWPASQVYDFNIYSSNVTSSNGVAGRGPVDPVLVDEVKDYIKLIVSTLKYSVN